MHGMHTHDGAPTFCIGDLQTQLGLGPSVPYRIEIRQCEESSGGQDSYVRHRLHSHSTGSIAVQIC